MFLKVGTRLCMSRFRLASPSVSMPIHHSNVLPSSLHGFFVFPKTFLSSYMAVFRFPQIEKAPNDGVRVLATSFTQKIVYLGHVLL